MTTPSDYRGFTLTELIVTLVLIGVLAVFVAPKFAGMSAVRERSEYDKVLSAITYARKAAVAKRRYACVSVCEHGRHTDHRPQSAGIDRDALRGHLPVRHGAGPAFARQGLLRRPTRPA